MTEPILASHGRKGPLAWVGLPLSLLVWFGLSHSGLVNSTLLPSPERVLASVGDIGPELGFHLAATILRVLIGYALAVALGAAAAIWMQSNRRVFAVLDGVIETWRPVPPVAMIPFFILLFGFSEAGRTALIVMGGSLVITVTVVEALHATPPELIRFGLLQRLSRPAFYRLILLPSATPRMIGGFRVAFALVLSLVVVSEFLGARFGLGYLVSVAKVTLTTSTMLLCTLLLGLIGLVGDAGLRSTFRYLSRWQSDAKDVER